MLLHDRLQLAIGKVLDTAINTELQVLARVWTADAFNILDNFVIAVLDDALGTRLTTQPVFIGQLNTFLTRVIDIGKTDHVCSHFTARIITAIFTLQMDTGNFKCSYLRSEIRTEVAL